MEKEHQLEGEKTSLGHGLGHRKGGERQQATKGQINKLKKVQKYSMSQPNKTSHCQTLESARKELAGEELCELFGYALL